MTCICREGADFFKLLTLNSALNGVGSQDQAPAALSPKRNRVPLLQKAGWAPGSAWIDTEKR